MMPTPPKRFARPHQLRALAFGAQRHRVAYFLEMRLGKCFVGANWLKSAGAFPALIIAPLSTLRTWLEECQLVNLKCVLLRGTRNELADLVEINRQVFITNYETAVNNPWLAEYDFEAVLLDESTRIKDAKTGTAKAILKHYRRAYYRAILSGAPTPEQGKLDILNQLLFLHDGYWLGCRDFWSLRNRLYERANRFRASEGWVAKPGTDALLEAEIDKLAIRITQQEAGFKTKFNRVKLYCELPVVARKKYNAILKDWAIDEREAKHAPVLVLWMRQLCSGVLPECPHKAKLVILDEALRDYVGDSQFLVWCSYLAEIDAVCQWLKARGVSHERIHGDVKEAQRHELRKEFQAGKFKGMVLHPACVKHGLDFSAADYAIWFSRPWSGDVNQQAEQRTNHLTKKGVLTSIDLVVEDTYEIEVQGMVGVKNLTSRAFMSRMLQHLKREQDACL